EALCFVVDGARTDGIYAAPIGFGLRGDVGVAIAFAGGSEEELRFLRAGEIESALRAQRTNTHGLNWIFQIVERASRRSEMEDVVDGAIDFERFADVAVFAAEARIPFKVREVRLHAGDQVV